MKALSIHEVRQAVGGKFLTAVPTPSPQVTTVSTDTRKQIEPGALFVCLKGENFDAHGFLPQVAGKGAVAAIVQDDPVHQLPNLHLIQVPDTRIALGKLATCVRQQLKAWVIGVAGSNGKTSTKHLINSVLETRLDGSMSPKSFNNDIGVPLTLFPVDPADDYVVLEMGTNHPGEIRRLTEMALPDIAVITNCGAEHLEFLGDLMGVRQENASIIEGMSEKGLLVVNGDDDELVRAIEHFHGKRLTFGFRESNDLFATDVKTDDSGVHFMLNDRLPVFVPLLGKHTACNALAAIAVGRRLGLSEEEIIKGLEHAKGPEMRLERRRVNGVTIVNDAYNANPNSMRAALETVAGLTARGRKIAVLGDMRELGKSSDRYHQELGTFAATCGLDALVCVGQFAPVVADAAEKAGMNAKIVNRCADAASAATIVTKWVREGDLVLLKGSRAIKLERVAEALASNEHPAARTRKIAS